MGKKGKKLHRILFYLPWAFDRLGGVDVVVDRLHHAFRKNPSCQTIIGIQSWEPSGKFFDTEGRRFVYLNFPELPQSGGLGFAVRYIITLVHHLPKAVRLLKSLEIDIINAHFPSRKLFPLALLRKFGLWNGQLVLSFHGSDVRAIDPDSLVWRVISSQTLACTVCSRSLAKELAKLHLFGKATVYIVHNGVDYESFFSRAQSPCPFSLPEGQAYILNVGNFIPRKGQDILLRAFAQISNNYPNLKLVFAGGKDNGQWLEALRTLSTDLNIGDRVHFILDVSHDLMPALMKNAICLIHSARQEPFGLVIIEAGVLGLPVIAAMVGGIPEIICRPEYGVLFPSEDVDALRNAITAVLDSTEEDRLRLGANLRQRVIQKFSSAVMANAYEAILCPMISDQSY